jgi:hypothetical protein
LFNGQVKTAQGLHGRFSPLEMAFQGSKSNVVVCHFVLGLSGLIRLILNVNQPNQLN